MTIYDLKPKFQNMLRPFVVAIWKMGITPNQITLVTCLLSVAVGLFLFMAETEMFIILPFFFFVRMALNAIDGMLAKEHDLKTPMGAILNEVTDVVSDGFLYFAFLRFSFISTYLLLFIIFFSALTEVTGLAAFHISRPRQFAGPMGKSDRAFVFSIMAIMICFGVVQERIYTIIISAVAVLLLVTIYNRIRKALT
ncbi:MAG: CDP-alcohol phosphatidyltransferase family protein [Bacteriovorax sp.]|jgi:CDP-diacylglycerol--glycerol-3-phosphate 3-phosphatidyltransferase